MDDLHVCVLADKSQLQRQAWVGFCFLLCVLEREGGEGEDFSGWVLKEDEGRQGYSAPSLNGLNKISGFRYCNRSLPSRQERTGLFWCVRMHACACFCVRARVQAPAISTGEE